MYHLPQPASSSASLGLDPHSGVASLSSTSPYTLRHGSLSDSSRALVHPNDGLPTMSPYMTNQGVDHATPVDLVYHLQEWTH